MGPILTVNKDTEEVSMRGFKFGMEGQRETDVNEQDSYVSRASISMRHSMYAMASYCSVHIGVIMKCIISMRHSMGTSS